MDHFFVLMGLRSGGPKSWLCWGQIKSER